MKTKFKCIQVLLFLFWLQGVSFGVGAANLPPLGPDGQPVVVSLTYDDALPVHHDLVAPLLEIYGLRGTFYLTVKMVKQPERWKGVAAAGHELGNHSLFHPCRRDPPGNYSWLAEHYDLQGYSLARLKDELAVANKFIDLLDGGKPRTYGNTCLNLFVGPKEQKQSIKPVVEELFVGARGRITNEVIFPSTMDTTQLGHFNGDGKSFSKLKKTIKKTTKHGGWIIFIFHGVGEGTHPLYIEKDEHRKLVQWLASEKERYWVAPVVDVVERFEELNDKAPSNKDGEGLAE